MNEYNKLVRDLIPDILDRKGVRYEIATANGEDFKNLLRTKLQEEIAEYLESGNAEELADILEVIYSLGVVSGRKPEELEELRKQKRNERGGFEKKIILVRAD